MGRKLALHHRAFHWGRKSDQDPPAHPFWKTGHRKDAPEGFFIRPRRRVCVCVFSEEQLGEKKSVRMPCRALMRGLRTTQMPWHCDTRC